MHARRALRDAVGSVDYLVLLGDIIDLSVASYEDAYRDARAFFAALQRDGLAREVVYVPGNHDFASGTWPIPWGSDELTDTVDGHDVRFCNTGGWVLKRGPDGGHEYAGAEVVVHETGRGVRSIPIRAENLAPSRA